MSWLRRSVIGLVIGIVTVATFKVSIAEEEPLTPARRQLLEREAAEFYQDGLRLFPAEPDTAIKHFRTAVEIAERLYPKGHGNLALSLQTLGTALSRNGRPDEAIPHLTRALKIWEEVLRGDPTDNENAADLGETANNLGAALLQLNRYPEAVLPCERAIQIEEKHFGTAHSASVQNLATAYIHTGRGEKAMPHLDRLLARQCAQLAGGLVIGNWGNPMAQAVMVHLLWSPQLIQEIPLVLHLIGNVHQSLRDPYRALAYHQSGYEWRRTVFPNRKNADLGVSLNYLAETYLILRRPDRACRTPRRLDRFWKPSSRRAITRWPSAGGTLRQPWLDSAAPERGSCWQNGRLTCASDCTRVLPTHRLRSVSTISRSFMALWVDQRRPSRSSHEPGK